MYKIKNYHNVPISNVPISLLKFQSINVILGNISIKRARPIDVCVRNLI